jgi:hypothetical protein
MGWTDLFLILFAVSGHFVLLPLVGAGILLGCFRMSGVREITFYQSWKVYFTAVASGLVLVVCVNLAMPWRQLGLAEVLALQAGLPCLTHLVVIAVLLGRYSRRALLAEGVGVLLTNLIVVSVMVAAAAA